MSDDFRDSKKRKRREQNPQEELRAVIAAAVVRFRQMSPDGDQARMPTLIELLDHMLEGLSLLGLALLIGCSDKLLYQLATAKRIPTYRIGSLYRVWPPEIAQWLRARRVGDGMPFITSPILHNAFAKSTTRQTSMRKQRIVQDHSRSANSEVD